MQHHRQQILQILEGLSKNDCRKKGFGVVNLRPQEDFTVYLKLGAATAALVLSQRGTKDLYQNKNAAQQIQCTDPIDEEGSVDRLISVQKELKRDVRTRSFRRKQDWIVPREEWAHLFTGTGITAVDMLVQTATIYIGEKGEEQTQGTMFYLPWNGPDIAGAARLICERMFDMTSDPIFNVGVVDRK